MFFWLLLDICAVNSYGVPFMTPFAPVQRGMWKDVLVRMQWRSLSRRPFEIARIDSQRKEENDAS